MEQSPRKFRKAIGRGFKSLLGLWLKFKNLNQNGYCMELVLSIETKNYQKMKDILLKDDSVSRASIVFKEGGIIGKEGYYSYIIGSEKQCRRALDLVKLKDEKTGEVIELAKEVIGKEKEELINKIKEEEDKAIEGFGNIMG